MNIQVFFSFYMEPFIYRTASITSVLPAVVHRGISFTLGLGFNPKVCVLRSKAAPLSREKFHNNFHKCQVCLSNERLWEEAVARCAAYECLTVSGKNLIRTKTSEFSCSRMSLCKKEFRASVDFKDAEDVRRGRGIAHSVESEGRARDGLQLRAFVQPQEAGHLAGLQEVERVWPGGGGRPVTLHALQLLRPLAICHHIQLHILRLLLIEQHLRRQG